MILLLACAVCAQEPAEKLEDVRTRIKTLEGSIQSARDEIETLLAELQHSESSLSEAKQKLHGVEAQIAAQLQRLDDLQSQKEGIESDLQSQREWLAIQINLAYRAGRHDYLKMLLNQEDPALVGRMLVYHDYFIKARTARIAEARQSLTRMQEVREELEQETLALEQLRARELAEFQRIEGFRASRTQAVERLRVLITGRGQELQTLQANERELIALLERLKRHTAVEPVFGDAPPFESLRGKLPWPAPGPIVDPFGVPKKGGKLRTQGVTIAAEEGTDVRAVGSGRVVFADWFRNLGLLLIIDHGGGFMSLYGHNEQLLKKQGDTVHAGDVISRVGDTGGQDRTGLYFELRNSGDPVDPTQWCRN